MYGAYGWWRYTTVLIGQTWHTWRVAVPQILAAWVGGWLLYQVALVVTGPLQESHPWLSVMIFSSGLVAHLAGIIVGIRVAGEPAGLWERLPPAAARIGRDEPLLRVVSVSLLPFVGVYSVFGGIDSATYDLFIYGALHSSALLDLQAATGILEPDTPQERLVMGGVLIIAFLARRGLETLADRTGRAVFGIVGALVEGFFSVTLVFGGSVIIGDLGDWLRAREFYGWIMTAGAAIMAWLASWHLAVPRIIASAWEFFSGSVWPLVMDGIMAPLLWLAVAGLVFGTYTLSVADLWEQGRERGSAGPQVRVSTGPLARMNRRITALESRGLHASEGSRAVVLEFFEVFVGDLEDRIVPFVQSLRHVLRVGLPFLGSYVVLYAVAQAIQPATLMLARAVIGGQQFNVWFRIMPPVDLVGGMIGEPVRLCLLAVAMTWTLRANAERDEDETRIAANSPGAIRAVVPAGGGRRVRRLLPTVVLTAVSLLVSGGISQFTASSSDEDLIPVVSGGVGAIAKGQDVWIAAVHGGRSLVRNGTAQPSMVSSDVFVAIDLQTQSRDRSVNSITCSLWAPEGGGSAVDAVLNDGVLTPQVGFRTTQTLVFERSADGLAGLHLRCKPRSFYLAYEPVLDFDLGLDEARAAELAAAGGIIQVIDQETEVIA